MTIHACRAEDIYTMTDEQAEIERMEGTALSEALSAIEESLPIPTDAFMALVSAGISIDDLYASYGSSLSCDLEDDTEMLVQQLLGEYHAVDAALNSDT